MSARSVREAALVASRGGAPLTVTLYEDGARLTRAHRSTAAVSAITGWAGRCSGAPVGVAQVRSDRLRSALPRSGETVLSCTDEAVAVVDGAELEPADPGLVLDVDVPSGHPPVLDPGAERALADVLDALGPMTAETDVPATSLALTRGGWAMASDRYVAARLPATGVPDGAWPLAGELSRVMGRTRGWALTHPAGVTWRLSAPGATLDSAVTVSSSGLDAYAALLGRVTDVRAVPDWTGDVVLDELAGALPTSGTVGLRQDGARLHLDDGGLNVPVKALRTALAALAGKVVRLHVPSSDARPVALTDPSSGASAVVMPAQG